MNLLYVMAANSKFLGLGLGFGLELGLGLWLGLYFELGILI